MKHRHPKNETNKPPHGEKKGANLRLVAWETTRNCNLNCVHCRAAATRGPYSGELDTPAAFGLLDQIAEIPLYAYPDLFRERFSRRGESLKSVGLPVEREALAQPLTFQLSAEPTEIHPACGRRGRSQTAQSRRGAARIIWYVEWKAGSLIPTAMTWLWSWRRGKG